MHHTFRKIDRSNIIIIVYIDRNTLEKLFHALCMNESVALKTQWNYTHIIQQMSAPTSQSCTHRNNCVCDEGSCRQCS